MTFEPTSANTRSQGFSGLIGPESYNLAGWENRITENLNGMIKMYVEDTHHLPSAAEYAEMAQSAIENTSVRGMR